MIIKESNFTRIKGQILFSDNSDVFIQETRILDGESDQGLIFVIDSQIDMDGVVF